MKRFADPGTTIRVEAGDSFAIELAGNPTTGYTWQPDVDSQHLELLGQEFEPGEGGVGAGGREIFRFRALKAGEAEIAFAYRRPWDKESRETSSFQVAISG
ncbi:MAG: protease inhibitor I42 family protein [Anaerolineae bacterium]